MRFLRRNLSFANVVALLALFVALGGSSYAVSRIDGRDIADRSIGERKLKRNTLGPKSILESRLNKVRRAARADMVGGLRASQLKVRCPSETYPLAGACLELRRRSAAVYGLAAHECALENKRLPMYSELASLLSGPDLSPPGDGELTSEVLMIGGVLHAIVVTNKGGGAAAVPDTADGARQYRCVSYPRN